MGMCYELLRREIIRRVVDIEGTHFQCDWSRGFSSARESLNKFHDDLCEKYREVPDGELLDILVDQTKRLAEAGIKFEEARHGIINT